MTDAQEVTALFVEAFGIEPAGVWSAPGRVNLIGEHTDYTGGFVMPFAIEQRAFVAARSRNDGVVRAVARDRGTEQTSLSSVKLGEPDDWLGYLAGAAFVAGDELGWDLALASDVPIGGGLSSSAAITCAALLAMNDLRGWNRERQDLATLAQRVEHDVIGTPCGIMDQTASLRCIEGHILMLDTRNLEVWQVPWPGAESALRLLITDTQAPHQLVDGQYARRRVLCEEATELLGIDQLRSATPELIAASQSLLSSEQFACARHVVSENERVLRARALLDSDEPELIGPLLTASHISLRDDFRVTVPQLDVAVEAALAAGALGARMTGGGFGGCTVTLVHAERVRAVQTEIDARFHAAGFGQPNHFLVAPSAGAKRES
jgi:galactokinase